MYYDFFCGLELLEKHFNVLFGVYLKIMGKIIEVCHGSLFYQAKSLQGISHHFAELRFRRVSVEF